MSTAVAPIRTAATVTAVTVAATTAIAAERSLDGTTLARWGEWVAADGIAAHEDEARRVVTAAFRRGLNPVLTDLLANSTEPAVARERAFGMLSLALAA